MIKPVIALAAIAALTAAAPVPKAPQTCLPETTLASYLCHGTDTRYVFTEQTGCDEPVMVFQACSDPPAEDPDTLAPAPPIEPGYDEHDPTGPGPGPEGATTADHPDVPRVP